MPAVGLHLRCRRILATSTLPLCGHAYGAVCETVSIYLKMEVSVAATRSDKARRKFIFQRRVARSIANPLLDTLEKLGIRFAMIVELETIGAKSAQPRRVPLVGRTDHTGVWVISLHGRQPGWVHNIAANPKVRVRVGNQWRSSTATFETGDDVRAQDRGFGGRGSFSRRVAAVILRALETDPVSVRIRYDFVSDHPRT